MAVQVLTDCKLWLAGHDLSGSMNSLALNYAAELQDNTTFGSGARSRLGGLKTVSVQHEGFWQGGLDNVDDALFQRIGLVDQPMTIAPETGATGEVAYTFLSALAQYSPGGAVGEMLAFSVSGEAAGSLVRGIVFENATLGASGSGTAFSLGAVTPPARAFAVLHVLSAAGTAPTLEVTVESAPDQGFASPTPRLTFAQATGPGAQWATPLAGPVTDPWWRASFTLGGSGPSFTFVVVAGVQ